MLKKIAPIVTIQLCASFSVNILLVMLTGLIYRNQGNVSILMILMTIPALIFSKIFGHLIDQNYSKKVLMVLTIILVALTIILLSYKLYGNIWILYSFAFCAYTVDLFVRLYLQVAATDLTSQQHYLKINSLFNTIENIGIVLGPVLGGIWLQENLSFYGFAVVGIFYACTFLSIIFIRTHNISKNIENDQSSAPGEIGYIVKGHTENKIKEIYFAACLSAFAIGLINVRQISFVITHYDTAEIGYSITDLCGDWE